MSVSTTRAKQPTLRAGYLSVALRIQEAAGDLSANDVRTRLSDAINDANRGTGRWAYYIDHFGDGESGDVIYSCDGDIMRAPYSISGGEASAAKCVIDMDNAEDVVPRTIYEPEAEEEDHYAAMEESYKRDGLYSGLPLYERFISKKERDAASADDFAGKGKSFPILKPEDVEAAARSIGRAGDKNLGPSGIKSRIIAIAKRKGWEKYLPKAWQSGGGKESAAGTRAPGDLHLTESAATLETIRLVESRADYEIKLIAPGKGSSAFYPQEVLKRDGPKVFSAGTHVYLNHPTAAEESARPEGDVSNLAGVLTTTAEYRESHAKGPGLYARMKVFADHAQMVEEKAPHVGMSIRANGTALTESGKPVMREGVPVLNSLTSAESVDVVTRAGAGGMILTEAARAATTHQEDSMDAAEIKKLQEAVTAQAALNARLLERALKGDAREEAAKILRTVSLPEAAKERVIDSVLREMIPQKDGALDVARLTESVNAAAKAEGAYLAQIGGAGRVFGMGAAAPVEIDAKEAERRAAQDKAEGEQAVAVFESLGMPKAAATFAAQGRAA